MNKRMLFYLIIFSSFFLFLFSCIEDRKAEGNKKNNYKYIIPYIPEKIGDTMLYVGSTHYSDIQDNFDTSYTDSIRLYQVTADSFYYLMKQVKYKEIPQYEGQNLENITLVEIYDRMAINDNDTFNLAYISEYFKQKTLIRFCCKDSLYLIETIDRASENKKEDRTFKGKLLK